MPKYQGPGIKVGGIQASAYAWRPLFWVVAGISAVALLLSSDLPFDEARRQLGLRYGHVALVNVYHGYHPTGRMDRQDLRLAFARTSVTPHSRLTPPPRDHGQPGRQPGLA